MTEEREKFRTSLSDATQRLEILANKFGNAIDKARPYYETKAQVNQVKYSHYHLLIDKCFYY